MQVTLVEATNAPTLAPFRTKGKSFVWRKERFSTNLFVWNRDTNPFRWSSTFSTRKRSSTRFFSAEIEEKRADKPEWWPPKFLRRVWRWFEFRFSWRQKLIDSSWKLFWRWSSERAEKRVERFSLCFVCFTCDGIGLSRQRYFFSAS